MCSIVADRKYVGEQKERIRMERLAEELLANHCMPALLHVKPSALVAVDRRKVINLEELLDIVYHMVRSFHCELYLLSQVGKRISLLIYSDTLLYHCLTNSTQMQFLARFGYEFHEDILCGILLKVKERYINYLSKKAPFPHEIGVILGYPVGDVEGFILNHGKNYLLCGAWKVYEEPAAAEKIFAEYQEIRERARLYLQAGGSITEFLRE